MELENLVKATERRIIRSQEQIRIMEALLTVGRTMLAKDDKEALNEVGNSDNGSSDTSNSPPSQLVVQQS